MPKKDDMPQRGRTAWFETAAREALDFGKRLRWVSLENNYAVVVPPHTWPWGPDALKIASPTFAKTCTKSFVRTSDLEFMRKFMISHFLEGYGQRYFIPTIDGQVGVTIEELRKMDHTSLVEFIEKRGAKASPDAHTDQLRQQALHDLGDEIGHPLVLREPD